MAPSVLQLEVEVPVEGLEKAKEKDQQIESESLDQLIDLYCSLRQKLDPKLAALKIEQKELEEVEKELLTALDGQHEPGEEGVRKTLAWMLSFGMKGNQFEVKDKKKLIQLIGIDMFLEIAEVSVTNMRKYLTVPQLAQVGEDVRKSKRKLTYAPVEQ